MSSPTSKGGKTAAQQALCHHQLIRPSPDTPWTVDVVSAMPHELVESGAISQARCVVAACSHERWNCLAVTAAPNDNDDDGSRSSSIIRLYVWYTSPTDSLQDQKHRTPVLQLVHNKLSRSNVAANTTTTTTTAPPPPLLLAMQVSPSSSETVYIYALEPTTGHLILWKLSTKDLFRPVAPPNVALCFIDLLDDDEEQQSSEIATCLNVTWSSMTTTSTTTSTMVRPTPMIVVGTSLGRLFWIHQTHVPISLTSQLIVDAGQHETRHNLLTRLFKTGVEDYSSDDDNKTSAAIFTALPINNNEFLAISKQGKVVPWNVTSSSLQHSSHYSFEESSSSCHPKFNLLSALRDYLTAPPLVELQVVQAAIGSSSSSNTNNINSVVHVLVLTRHKDDESRLYWVVLEQELSNDDNNNPWNVRDAIWLSRFYAPESVRCETMVVADNHIAYAAFGVGYESSSSSSWIVMALDEQEESESSSATVHELDMPTHHVGAILTMTKDVVTHGCAVWTTSGLGVRVRMVAAETATTSLQQQQQQQQQHARGSNPAVIATLRTHLWSSFWKDYQSPKKQQKGIVKLPPSLNAAEAGDLEEAVLVVAQQLQHKGHASASQNPMEWHSALITFLQQAGLYRSLSTCCRWNLLAIGQEVAVFRALSSLQQRSKKMTEWEMEELIQLAPDKVADWLGSVQNSVLKEGGGEDRQERYLEWFKLALKEAMMYREESEGLVYDISLDRPPQVSSVSEVPVWTSQLALQQALKQQIVYWKVNRSTAHVDNVETVVEVALVSFKDSYVSCRNDETEKGYALVQKEAIPLLRKVKGLQNDQLAFRLSREHHYFGGLCQIALDHEKRSDRTEYSLLDLFDLLEKEEDVHTRLLFPMFVLKWHSDRDLFGHVLKYGKFCPEALSQLMLHEEKLRPYRWIQAVRAGDYDGATVKLVENASSETSTLPEAKLNLSIASIANQVVEEESMTHKDAAKRRRVEIDKKRELVNAQESLFGEEASKSRLWSPDSLLDYALRQFDETQDRDEKVNACFIGLAICTTFATIDEMRSHAAEVWFKAIMEDSDLWQQWVSTEMDLTEEKLVATVLRNTIFGALFRQCEDIETWDKVKYGVPIESDIFDKFSAFDAGFVAGLRRLLRSAIDAAPIGVGDREMTNQSLLVASFE